MIFISGKLISVIIPVYNVEKYLRKCVDSVIAQTYGNLEIILVDDGSPDNCPAICDEYAQRDSRIKVIHKQNGGLSDARNAGLEIACGEYIGFIDSDDYVSEKMYEVLCRSCIESGSDIAVCGYITVDEIEKSEKIYGFEKNEVKSGKSIHSELALKPQYITVWNKLFKADIIKGIRFPVGKLHEDEFVAHRIYFNAEKVSLNSENLYYYLQRKGSIVHSKSRKSYDWIEAFDDRARFYAEHGAEAFIPYAKHGKIRYFRYFYCDFVPVIIDDGNWVREKLKENKKTFFEVREMCNIKDKLFYAFPDLYRTAVRVLNKNHITGD